ncbi:TE1 [Symbiodinium microadriaticum]|nr:TE1 [Symbiodinium microadriaticum]
MFLAMLDEHGFAGCYDFVYLPRDFQRKANLGYAFVNLVDGAAADALWRTFDGFSSWALPTAKVCQVSWSGLHQGFKAAKWNFKMETELRNSAVMHKKVPDEYKPVIFANGVRKNFPRPSKKVKASCWQTLGEDIFKIVVGLKHADRHSDVESTVAGEHSDIETVEDSCPSEVPSPRSSGTADVCEDEEGLCNVVVRSTFIDVDDGRSLMQRYRQLRRAMTDSLLTGAVADEAQEAVSAPSVPAAPAEPAPQPAAGTGRDAKQASAERTTLMLRNVPNNYSREMFLAMLNEHGFAGRYDFVYLPCDFYRQANLGYAFVNLVDGAAVDALWRTFDGFSGWALPTAKVCQVSWSGPHQGFKAHVERYRNSPVMHRSVPDEYKPVIFKNGVRKNFPRPTKKVKAPTAGF